MVKYDGIEKYIFADVYNLFLKYKDIPDEEYYWNVFLEDYHILRFKYGDTRMVNSMLLAVMEQLEIKVSHKEQYYAEVDRVGKLLRTEFGR